MVAWAKSDSPQVHSENDVVYLLSAWVQAQEAAGLPCSTEQLELLVGTVRLDDCGHSYERRIVPALDWFRSGRKALGKFDIAQALRYARQEHTRPSEIPDAWWADTSREELTTCKAVVDLQVSAEKLKELDVAGSKRIYLSSVCINGFWMMAFLKSCASKTAGEVTLGCFVMVDDAKAAKPVPWPEHAAVAFACSMQLKGKITFTDVNII
ncbi:hypothetical protein FOA52_014154 [Chlamydomonas sp. UWO 241]|nr:hypothetical protein FOA52_014154 [Chlamydomonas sp. UWO 241]